MSICNSPPSYTTMYVVTSLTNEEFEQAIADKIIHPGLKRKRLEKWHRELRPNPRAAANDSTVTGPIVPVYDVVENGVLPTASSQHEISYNLKVQDQSAINPERADKESEQSAEEASDDQSIAPEEDADKSARRTGDGKFEHLKFRWQKYIATDWKDAPEETKARFVAEVLGYPERVG